MQMSQFLTWQPPSLLMGTHKKQTSFNSALQTNSADEEYEMYCLLEASQQNKDNLLPKVC